MRRLLFFLTASFLCQTGCNLAPKYTRPDTPLPTSWRVESDEMSAICNLNWWKGFGDEVLDGFIEAALENNKDLQVAAWRVSEYFAQYQVALAPLFPQLSAGGSALKEKLGIDSDFLPPGVSPITPDYRLSTSVSFEFDFWCKTRNASSAAFSEYLAQVENRRTVVLSLVSSVAQAYVLLRQLDLQLDIARQIVDSRRESLQIARYRFEGGLTSEIEVEQSLSVYEESLAVMRNLERRVPQQENALSVLLGQNPGPIKRGKSLRKLMLPKEIETGLPSDLLIRRPDILQAENNLIAANANIGVARAAFFPQVSLSGIYGVDSLQLRSLFKNSSEVWALGGSFLQTLFAGGALVGQLKVAKAQQKELVFAYEQSILKAFQEVNDSLIGFKKSKEIFSADQADVIALKAYLQLAWYRYYDGLTEYLTVLDAERKVFDAELNLASAQSDQFLVLIELYKALGGGWVLEADKEAALQDQ